VFLDLEICIICNYSCIKINLRISQESGFTERHGMPNPTDITVANHGAWSEPTCTRQIRRSGYLVARKHPNRPHTLNGLTSVNPNGKTITISAAIPEDTNSITDPTRIVPVTADGAYDVWAVRILIAYPCQLL
jgi:hypothetical protein